MWLAKTIFICSFMWKFLFLWIFQFEYGHASLFKWLCFYFFRSLFWICSNGNSILISNISLTNFCVNDVMWEIWRTWSLIWLVARKVLLLSYFIVQKRLFCYWLLFLWFVWWITLCSMEAYVSVYYNLDWMKYFQSLF